MRPRYSIVGYRSKSGKLASYKKVGESLDKFNEGKKRAHLKSWDGKLSFWVDAEKLEAPPPMKKKSGCSCEMECCVPYCHCEPHCNCNSGYIYDC